jgi:hypothetical protein
VNLLGGQNTSTSIAGNSFFKQSLINQRDLTYQLSKFRRLSNTFKYIFEKSKEIRNNTLSSERPEQRNLLSAFEER